MLGVHGFPLSVWVASTMASSCALTHTPLFGMLFSPPPQGSSFYRKPSVHSPGSFPSSGLFSHRKTEPYASLTAHIPPVGSFWEASLVCDRKCNPSWLKP